MKINGVDIEECETAILLKNYKMYLIMIPGYFLFAFFMLICSFASRSVLMEEGMGIAVLIMLIGAVVFTCVAVSFINKAKCIKAELNSRIISNAEEESAKNSIKNLVIITVGFLVAAIIITLIAVGGVGDGDSGGGSVTCPNCGTDYRSGHSAAEFVLEHGYCPSCHGR